MIIIQLGIIQTMKIDNISKGTAYLTSGEDHTIPLIKTDYKSNMKPGDRLKVFVYREYKEKLVATTKRPLIQVGQIKILEIVDKTNIGYFVDIGLPRDVLLPFSEAYGRVEVGSSYLMRMYVDKSYRLALTMDIKKTLKKDSKYKENDTVIGTIYGVNKDIGLFVAVDDTYDSLVPIEHAPGIYELGEQIEARVLNQNPKGQLVLSTRGIGYNLETKEEDLLQILNDNNGTIPIGSKSNPRIVEDITGMSMDQLLQVADKLQRERKIQITEDRISIWN